ncbi:DMT family transporter [Candidatus Babeliales bacterium]|nr:DMT family transporter [Candidatus Babeliales bacterium]
MITVILMYAILAASFTVAKTAIAYATPYFLVGFRFTLAGTLFLTLQYIFNRKKFFLRKQDVPHFFWIALFYVYLAFVPEFWALQYLTSTKVVILYSITPFFVAIFAYFLAAERFTVKKITGMILGFAGTIPILMIQDDIREAATEILKISLPEVVLLIAIISGAYAWFPLKKLMNKGYSLPMINGVTMLLGGLAALTTSFFIEGVFVTHIFSFWPFLGWILLLILLSNGLFYNLYGWHLRRYSFTLLSFAGFLCPIFGSLYGWYFLSESIKWNHFISLFLVGSGLYLFYRDELVER